MTKKLYPRRHLIIDILASKNFQYKKLMRQISHGIYMEGQLKQTVGITFKEAWSDDGLKDDRFPG